MRLSLLAAATVAVAWGVTASAATVRCPASAIGTTTLKGTRSADVITGCAGPDEIRGYGGDDDLQGRGGNDFIFGGAGKDVLSGGNGNDKLDGDSGADTLRGGRGLDVIDARDSSVDRVVCGAGRDLVEADRHDKVARDCEQVQRTGGRP